MSQSTIITHVYDINLTRAYLDLMAIVRIEPFTKRYAKKDEFSERMLDAIKVYCEDNSIDFEYLYSHNLAITVPSNNSWYPSHLGFVLMSYDVHRINRFLDYQQKDYKGKDSFINILEFVSYRYVLNTSPFKNDERLSRIMRWIEKRRTAEEKLVANKNVPSFHWAITTEQQKIISKRIWKAQATEKGLDFFRAINEDQPIKWKKSPDLLAHLIYTLVSKGHLTFKNSKGYFKAIQAMVDYSQKSTDKLRLSELSSRINKQIINNPANRKVERDFVAKILRDIK